MKNKITVKQALSLSAELGYPLSISTLYRRRKCGEFPQPTYQRGNVNEGRMRRNIAVYDRAEVSLAIQAMKKSEVEA